MIKDKRPGGALVKIVRQTQRTLLFALRQLKLERFYLLASMAVLGLSTLFWATLGAKIQSANADQLVSGYLFQSHGTIQGAIFPSSHSFLIKWPLFALIKVFGLTSSTLTIFTIGLVLATVAMFALILYSIERRPIVLATIYLALASVLMLVPAVPSAGNLLPENMAMITTRNFEYVLYIASIMLLIKNYRLRSWHFWLGALLLTLLGASDKIFLYFSLGGALAALIVYGLSSGWNLVSFSSKWVLSSLLSIGGSLAVLKIVSSDHIARFNEQSVGPYGFVHSLHSIALGAIYAAAGILDNFGANAAFDTTIVKSMPARAVHNILLFGGLGFILNFIILALGIFACISLLLKSLKHNKNNDVILESSAKLSVALIWSSLAALIIFIGTDHYYAGDARYLAITFFTAFIGIATVASYRVWPSHRLVAMGELLTLGILLSVPGMLHAYRHDQKALQPIKDRNVQVVAALNTHKVDYLVGDYWRVIPTKFANPKLKTQPVPLQDCTTMKPVLTTKIWQPDLNKHSFAYLLTYDHPQTDYPQCNLGQIVKVYGRPNTSILLKGDFAHPTESLLFYDYGIHKSSPVTPPPPQGTATVVPATLDQLPYAYCPVPTIMNIVAHEDDDLLFMNPDILHDIQTGHCIRTVYVTAGDGGNNRFYWFGRQQGSEAAYSQMLNTTNIWVERILKINEKEYVTVANPRGDSRISLIFMYLPDGNMRGQGFAATNYESLESLGSGKISSINSVYGGSTYSSSQLTNAFTALMHVYQPTEIRTQSNYTGPHYNDHSDHKAVGRFVAAAYNTYISQRFEGRQEVPLKYYLGYTGHEHPPNVVGADLSAKQSIFLQYSKFDGAVCRNLDQCIHDPAYGIYLPRQYENSN